MTTLALTDPDHCPACGERLNTVGWDQPALFIHGGYGATQRRAMRVCSCGYWLTTVLGEVSPRATATA